VIDPYAAASNNGGSGTGPAAANGPDQQQAAYLRDALAQARRAGALVRRAADQGNLREALRYSAAMLGELRTGFLGPQQYYELYVAVGDELEALAQFLQEETEAAAASVAAGSNGVAPPVATTPAGRAAPPRSAAELYEAVQHAGNVLPRLYLMVLAGSILARSPGCPQSVRARDVLFDLAEMAKGVQHPLRGLFLRAFLCQRARPVLCPPPLPPAAGALSSPPPPPSVEDAVDFLLANFVESNKLWVRMQQQQGQRAGGGSGALGGAGGSGPGGISHASSLASDRREQERAQLRDLVGKNVTQLAQLDGLDFALYRRAVLPRLLEQIVSCRDALAQGYLMQVVVQGFPDAWHAGTLDELLAALPELQPGVRLAAVVASLADRLARFAAEAGGGGGGGGGAAAAPAVVLDLRSSGALERLSAAVSRASAAHGGGISAASVVEMHAALATFARAVAGGGAAAGGAAAAAGAAAGTTATDSNEALARVDKVLRDCREALLARAGAAAAAAAAAAGGAGGQGPELAAAAAAAVAAEAAAERALASLLSEPFDSAASPRPIPLPQVLRGLPSLPPLAALLPPRARRALAARVANAALAQLGGAGGAGGSAAAPADAKALRTAEMADRLFVFVAPLLGAEGAGLSDDDAEEDVLLAARVIHALLAAGSEGEGCGSSRQQSDPRARFAALKAVRPHVERAPSRRARMVLLPTLAFGALRLVRALQQPSRQEAQDAATATTATTAPATTTAAAQEEALQWVLEVALALAADSQLPLDASAAVAAALGAPAVAAASSLQQQQDPAAEAAAAEGAAVAALRVLLAGALAASEELRSEALAYEFCEQALTLYEESGVSSSARHRAPALQAIVGALHRCRALGAEGREALAQSAGGYAGKLLHRADQCRAVLASAHLAWQDEDEDAAAVGSGQRYPPCRDSAKVMAALKRALKVAQAAKQQRVLVGGGGAVGSEGGAGGAGGGVSAAQAAHAAHAALASATYLGLAVSVANKYLYFYARGVEGLTAGAVQQLLELVAAEVASGGGSGEAGNAAAAALAAAAAAGGPTAAVAAAAARADAEARRFWAATLAHVAHQQKQEEAGGGGGSGAQAAGAPFSALTVPAAASTALGAAGAPLAV
jgi:vacuolar protein sorting-associated protein 35